MRPLTLAPLILLTSCASVPRIAGATYFDSAVPLCRVVQDPAPYVGVRTNVRGFLFVNPHGGTFIDEDCERGELLLFDPRYQNDDPLARKVLRFAQRRNALARVPVVFSGVLTDHNGPNGSRGMVCKSGSLCSRYSFNKSTLVAARIRSCPLSTHCRRSDRARTN